MSEITAPPFAERTAGANKAGRSRRRLWLIATLAVAVVVVGGGSFAGHAVHVFRSPPSSTFR